MFVEINWWVTLFVIQHQNSHH